MNKNQASLIRIFKALSDENRLTILSLIYNYEAKCRCDKKEKCLDETCIKNLSDSLSISLSTTSHHIKELVNAQLITKKKKDRWVYCQINRKVFAQSCEFLNRFSKEMRYEENRQRKK